MIDITTLTEISDPLNVAPNLNTPKTTSNKYLWIILLALVAIFAIIWYLAIKESKSKQIKNS